MNEYKTLLNIIAARKWKNGYLTILVNEFKATQKINWELVDLLKPKEAKEIICLD
jgi:hypothetical protein